MELHGYSDDWKYGYSNIDYCCNVGDVYGKGINVGGISGFNGYGCGLYYSANSGKVEGGNNVGEIYGSNSGYSNNNQSYSDILAMPSIISIIQGEEVFVEDTENINGGYPLLAWQVE